MAPGGAAASRSRRALRCTKSTSTCTSVPLRGILGYRRSIMRERRRIEPSTFCTRVAVIIITSISTGGEDEISRGRRCTKNRIARYPSRAGPAQPRPGLLQLWVCTEAHSPPLPSPVLVYSAAVPLLALSSSSRISFLVRIAFRPPESLCTRARVRGSIFFRSWYLRPATWTDGVAALVGDARRSFRA